MLYLVYCESQHYCGAGQYFLVKATSDIDAEEKVIPHAEEYFWEQEGHQLIEDGFDQGDGCSTVITVEPFDKNHEYYGLNNADYIFIED